MKEGIPNCETLVILVETFVFSPNFVNLVETFVIFKVRNRISFLYTERGQMFTYLDILMFYMFNYFYFSTIYSFVVFFFFFLLFLLLFFLSLFCFPLFSIFERKR